MSGIGVSGYPGSTAGPWPGVAGRARPAAGSADQPPSAAVIAARQRLAKADALVDADKAAHSPSCVACDEKLVASAEIALGQASAAAASGPGSLLDVSV
jgi:hypothetical protein